MNCLRVCKFYARGACLKGDQCDFAHEKKDDVRCNSNSGFYVCILTILALFFMMIDEYRVGK